jgi:hypothetical protein
LPECPIYGLGTRHQLLYHQHCSTHPFSKMSHTQLTSTASKTLALDQRLISRLHRCWLLTAIERTVPPNSVKCGGPILAPSTRGSSLGKSAYPSPRISCSPNRFFKSRTRAQSFTFRKCPCLRIEFLESAWRTTQMIADQLQDQKLNPSIWGSALSHATRDHSST